MESYFNINIKKKYIEHISAHRIWRKILKKEQKQQKLVKKFENIG